MWERKNRSEIDYERLKVMTVIHFKNSEHKVIERYIITTNPVRCNTPRRILNGKLKVMTVVHFQHSEHKVIDRYIISTNLAETNIPLRPLHPRLNVMLDLHFHHSEHTVIYRYIIPTTRILFYTSLHSTHSIHLLCFFLPFNPSTSTMY